MELSKELIDQIIFGMENQDHIFYLDVDELRLYTDEEYQNESREMDIQEIPRWRSVDGYNLMERFVSQLNNPLVKIELQKILQSGRGVFRQFKNRLKEHREVEKLWFTFKDREMKRAVVDWFNSILESRGLEALKYDFTETDDLVLSDFDILQVLDQSVLKKIADMDHAVFSESFEDPAESAYWYSFRRDHLPAVESVDDGCFVLGAFLSERELCGFIWVLHDELDERRSVAHILQVYVDPQYRGLGVATTLISEYLVLAKKEQVEVVTFENWSRNSFLDPMLERQGFSPQVRLFAARPGKTSVSG